MSPAEKQAIAWRDLAVNVAKSKGATTTQAAAPEPANTIRIRRCPTARRLQLDDTASALDVFRRGDLDLKVLSVIWQDGGDALIVLHRAGWEDSLRRLAKVCR